MSLLFARYFKVPCHMPLWAWMKLAGHFDDNVFGVAADR
jgi:hypothetical protein